jgi:hypothetical protein
VAEDQDLQILVGLGTAAARHQPEQPHERPIEEGQEHEAGFSQTDRVATTGAPNRVFVPHAFRYIRSIDSISRVTWRSRMRATLVARLIFGSGCRGSS